MSTKRLIEFVKWSKDQESLSPAKVVVQFNVSMETAERWLAALLACHEDICISERSGSPVPIRIRAMKALLLAPMTNQTLAKLLCVTDVPVSRVTANARMNGWVKIIDQKEGVAGHPQFIYALTPKGQAIAREMLCQS